MIEADLNATLPQQQEQPQSLEELLAASEAQSQGGGSVPSTSPSPDGNMPAGTPSGTPSGVPSQDTSLEALLKQSEGESQKSPSETMPQEDSHSPFGNMAGGLNNRIADAVHGAYWLAKGAAMGPINDISSMVKGEKPKEISTGGPEYEASKQQFKTMLQDKLGLQIERDPNSTMAHIGENTVDAMLTLGGFYAAAPRMAAATGQSVASYIQRSFGKTLLDHPWLAMTSDIVGGVPGSTVGEEKFGSAGSIAGGVVGNIATAPIQIGLRGGVAGARRMGLMAKKAADTIVEAFGGKLPNADMLGQKAAEPHVSEDMVQAYRTAESQARAAGEGVVQAQSDMREAKRGGNFDEIYRTTKTVWALKKDETQLGKAAEQAYQALPKEVRGKYSRDAMAIRDEFSDTVYPKEFAEEQINGEKKIIDDSINKALDAIRPNNAKDLNSQDYSKLVSKGIHDAYDTANSMERRMWKRVDILDQRMPEKAGPQSDIDTLLNDMRSRTPDIEIPMDQIKGFRKLFASQSSPGVFQPLPTVRRLRGEISALDQARRQNLAGDAPNPRLDANYTRLEAMANKWIDDAFPNSVPLKQARAFSSYKHELFTKSELFPFLAQGARGQERIKPRNTIEKLLSRSGALDDMYKAINGLAEYKRMPDQAGVDAYPTALRGWKEKQPLLDLQSNIENGIKQSFREEIEASRAAIAQRIGEDPSKTALVVEKTMNRWQPRIQAFSKAASEMQLDMTKAMDGVKARMDIERSSMVKYFESNDPEKAIEKIWSSPNSAKVAKALISGEAGIGGFSKDPIAMEGFRSANVDRLMQRAANDPKRVQVLLRDPRVSRLMETVLGGDRYSRLERIVDLSVKQQIEGETGTRLQSMVWLARLAAVKVSALLPRLGAGGQLQQAAMFSELAKQKVMRMMTGDPSNTLIEALRNPHMERMLYSTPSADAKAMKQDMLLTRRMLRFDVGIRGAMEAVMRHDDDKDAPGPLKEVPSLEQKVEAQHFEDENSSTLAGVIGLTNKMGAHADFSKFPESKNILHRGDDWGQNIDKMNVIQDAYDREDQRSKPRTAAKEIMRSQYAGRAEKYNGQLDYEDRMRHHARLYADVPNKAFGPLAAQAGINDIPKYTPKKGNPISSAMANGASK